jgi:hypothetical protein
MFGNSGAGTCDAAEGWPTVTAADWVRVRDEYLRDLGRAVAFPATGRIDPPLEHPPLADYEVEDALIHVAQHNAHHLGQCVAHDGLGRDVRGRSLQGWYRRPWST